VAYNIPEDVLKAVNELEKRIVKLERAPRAGNTSIDSGSFTLVNPNTGNTVFYVGQLSNGDYGIEMYRDDGKIALRIGRVFISDPEQILALYNRGGTAIGGDQFLDYGGMLDYAAHLATPIAGAPQVAVTSGTFVDTHLIYTVSKSSLARFYFTAICTDGTTSGELRMTDSTGTPLTGFFGATVDPVVIPLGTTTETNFNTDTNTTLVFATPSVEGDPYTIKIQAKRTAGAGTMNIRPQFLYQHSV